MKNLSKLNYRNLSDDELKMHIVRIVSKNRTHGEIVNALYSELGLYFLFVTTLEASPNLCGRGIRIVTVTTLNKDGKTIFVQV